MIHRSRQPIRNFVEHFSLTTRFLTSKLTRSFRAKIPLLQETPQYRLKTADTVAELDEVLRLRHQIFYRELQGRSKWLGIELDAHDFQCDHLLIQDRVTGEIVGTYRLLCSRFTHTFYSSGEFDLGRLLEAPGAKLELGRLCIHEDHRNGVVMQLLWRGVTEYMSRTDARYLIGCSSVQTIHPAEIMAITERLHREGKVSDSFGIRPIGVYHPRVHGIDTEQMECGFDPPSGLASSPPTSNVTIPSLIDAYLSAGAKLAPLPAIDLDFNCVDFLTVLDREALNPLFRRRYFSRSVRSL